MLPEFILLEEFEQSCKRLNINDDNIQKLQKQLCDNIEVGDRMPGTHGLRKVRIPLEGRGTRGGGRACYAVFRKGTHVYLLTAYAKNEKSDLTMDEKARINKILDGIKEKYKEFEDFNANNMTVGQHIIRGLEQMLEYLNGNHSVGRKVTYVPKKELALATEKLTIRESFSAHDIENLLTEIEVKWGFDIADAMLDWLIEHSDNADELFDRYGEYIIDEMEFWVSNNQIESVMLNCLEFGRVEDI